MIYVRLLLWIILFFDLVLVFKTLLSQPLKKLYINKLNKINVNKYPNIYVLLPALREQQIVRETIDWFSKIKYNGKIQYIIITTEREEHEYKLKKLIIKTTNELVNEISEKNKCSNFIHLHYPQIYGNKSSQLNYAVKEIMNIEKDFKNTYISVYDFDSKPDVDTFNTLGKVYEMKSAPDVIGQVPLSFKNLASLSYKKENCFLILGALQQTIRSCGIEKFRLIVSSFFNVKLPQYCMGACMHIRLDTLVNNGLFPIFVDDLTLGYRLTINNARFAYLPNFNYVLIPNKLSQCFNQAVLIFKGVLTSFSEVKKSKGCSYGKFLIIYEGITNVLKLTLVPYLIIFFYIYSIIIKSYDVLFYMLLLLPYLWSLTAYYIVRKHKLDEKKTKTIYIGILFSPLWLMFRTFGALIYYKKYILAYILKREIKYMKTER